MATLPPTPARPSGKPAGSGGGGPTGPAAPPPVTPPVVAVDGPAASGKGTIAASVASALGFHLLDSGALYRLVALVALRQGVAANDAPALTAIATGLCAKFTEGRVLLSGEDVGEAIRAEACSVLSSQVAVHPGVRAALLDRQRAFRRAPGLVADGRDMGTVVFPDAELKIYVTASAEERARRRHKQLMDKGFAVSIHSLLHEIRERDARDSGRAQAPLRAAADAIVLDTTALTPDQAVALVLQRCRERGIEASGAR
jgi:3-phosphoshikimate 1-carboxyvinyltransferase